MRDFQEFIGGEYMVVSFKNKKQMVEFLELCEKNAILWQSGKTATGYLPDYECGIRFSGTHLCHAPLKIYIDDGDLVVPAAEFLPQSTPVIEIFQSKQTVVCLKKQDNKVVAVGKAKCNPEDEFDFEFGATLAYQRMIGLKPLIIEIDDGLKTLKNGMRIKKQDKYEVGDRVLMKKKQRPLAEIVHPGEIGVITVIGYGDCYGISFDGEETEQHYINKRIKGKVIQ